MWLVVMVPWRRDFVVMMTSSGSESGTANGIDDLLLTIPDGLTDGSSLDSELFFRCTSTLKSMANLKIIKLFRIDVNSFSYQMGLNPSLSILHYSLG